LLLAPAPFQKMKRLHSHYGTDRKNETVKLFSLLSFLINHSRYKYKIETVTSLLFLGSKKWLLVCRYPQKMMWLVEIIRQEVNAVVIPEIFPLLHRGY
jgi:hypothetical protein